MAKLATKKLDQFLREIAASTLTATETKVLMDWFQDSPGYHASSTLCSERTGIDLSSVKKARKSLREQGVLIEDGFHVLPSGTRIRKYKLGNIPIRSGASLSPPQVNIPSLQGGKVPPSGVVNLPPIHPKKHLKTNADRFEGFPGAKKIYDSLTEEQYGSMSKEEYAIQRAHADSFPRVDWENLPDLNSSDVLPNLDDTDPFPDLY